MHHSMTSPPLACRFTFTQASTTGPGVQAEEAGGHTMHTLERTGPVMLTRAPLGAAQAKHGGALQSKKS